MSDHALAGCIAKLNRAEDQLDGVQDAIASFLSSGFVDLVADVDRQGRLVARAGVVRDPGDELAVLIGECAYTFRSALDHLAYQLGVLDTGGPLDDRAARASAFPIFDNGPRYRRDARRKIAAMSRAAQADIERLQPYHRRRQPDARALTILDELCNVDKHRMLHPTGSMLVGSQFKLEGQGLAMLRSIEVFPRMLREGAMLARFTGRFDGEVKVTSNLRYDVVFGADSAAVSARRESVFSALVAIRDFIALRVMPSLAKHFPGKYGVAVIPPPEKDRGDSLDAQTAHPIFDGPSLRFVGKD